MNIEEIKKMAVTRILNVFLAGPYSSLFLCVLCITNLKDSEVLHKDSRPAGLNFFVK